MTTNSNIPTFANREEYVAWRSQWRIEYAELSAAIRKMKNARKEYLRQRTSRTAKPTKTPNPNYHPEAGWRVSGLRYNAAAMMLQREEVKKRAPQKAPS